MNARVMVFATLLPASLSGQSIMGNLKPGSSSRLLHSDATVLDLRDVSTSLPCVVKPVHPELGFDLAFHAGFEVRMRLRDLAGEGNVLTGIFRVTPDRDPGTPVYFQQKWKVPPIPEDAKDTVVLDGTFALGQGGYQVDWLMRDLTDRVCSAHWRMSANIPGKAEHIAAGPAPGAVLEDSADRFSEQHVPHGKAGGPLVVKILLNVSPQVRGGVVISPRERHALFSILRGIEMDPSVGTISVTAFNLDQSQIIFHREDTQHIDFPGLVEAIDSLDLGTVSVSRLAEKDSEARFLIELTADTVKSNPPDALIFVGPKIKGDAFTTSNVWKRHGEAGCPVFYLTYDTVPNLYPWPDFIGDAVRHWKGREFTIRRPVDLLIAWSRIMSQVSKDALGGASLRRTDTRQSLVPETAAGGLVKQKNEPAR
jgi:hypothetical protein